MKVNEITIKIKPSKIIKEYYAVDLIIETDIDIKERHELLQSDDLVSKFDSMVEILKEELKYSIKEYDI